MFCPNAAYKFCITIFTYPYYVDCLYLSQMRQTQLSLLQMVQKTKIDSEYKEIEANELNHQEAG